MMNPLGKYGNVVAALVAVMVIAAWLGSELGLLGTLASGSSLADVAKLTIGVIFGTQVVQNGTQTKAVAALAQAEAANRRIDAMGIPAASAVGVTPTPTDPTPPSAPTGTFTGFRHDQ